MSTLFESQTSSSSVDYTWGVFWNAQTFTPAVSHTITSVKIQAYREGSPGILTVSIRNTNGDGKPTGEDLCVGTINANSFTASSPGEWYEISFSPGAPLAAGTKYAIVCRAINGSEFNQVDWRQEAPASTYPNGARCYSSDSGATWTVSSIHDFTFEDWGEQTMYRASHAASEEDVAARADIALGVDV